MNPLAQSIYLARLDRGLSQQQLADRARMPQPRLSQIEKGRDFKVSTLLKLASALDLPLADLISGPVRPIDTKGLFQRRNIENTIANVVRQRPVSKRYKLAAQLISSAVVGPKGGYHSKKQAHLSWHKLKRSFSGQEISAILSKVRKAERRSA